jgi:hypothetical protein
MFKIGELFLFQKFRMVGKRAEMNRPKFEDRAARLPTLQGIWNKNSQSFFRFKKLFINSYG